MVKRMHIGFFEKRNTGHKIQKIHVFLFGFLIGIFTVSFGKDFFLKEAGLFSEELLLQMKYSAMQESLFFFYLLQKRFFFVVMLSVLATTFFGVIAVMGSIIWIGFSFGMLFWAGILQYGLKGMLLFGCSLIPHFLFYVPAFLLLANWCMELCSSIYFPSYTSFSVSFNKKQLLLKLLARWILIVFIFLTGVFVEAYVNPSLLGGLLSIF